MDFILPDGSLESQPLTRREYQILQLLAKGLSNKEIATVLCLSDKTIGTHMKSLFDKLKVHNRVMAVRAGQRLGLVSPDGELSPAKQEI